MKTPNSMDLHTAWWEQFRRSDKVPANVVVPAGEWLIIEVSLCKTLMRDAEKDLLASIPLQRSRAAAARNRQQQQQRKPGEARPGKQQPPPNDKKKCRICRTVHEDGHKPATCPKRTGQPCHKWMAGGESKCDRGVDCCYEHPVGPAAPTSPAAPATPAVVPAAPHGAPPPYKPAVVRCSTSACASSSACGSTFGRFHSDARTWYPRNLLQEHHAPRVHSKFRVRFVLLGLTDK